MIKKEIIDNFGLTRKTLNNWENDTDSKRYVLYKMLEALPVEYVEGIKRKLKEEKENNEKLNLINN